MDDMRTASDSILQPLSTQIAQRAGHRFTLIFIEQSSSKGRPVAEMNDESESRILPNVLSIFTTPIPINVPVQGDL